MHRLRALAEKAREAFWVLPALAIGLGMALGLVVPAVDRHVALPDALSFSGDVDTARTVLTAVATIGISTAGVSFSVIVVALVLASQQLSPRVLRSFQRRALNQTVLAVFLATAVFALFALGSVGDTRRHPVPELAVTLAMAFTAISVALFVLFIHHAVRSLNASVVIRRIAADGHRALSTPYPCGVGEEVESDHTPHSEGEARPVHAPRAGYVSSVDGQKLLDWARRGGGFVEQRRALGDFAVSGAVLAVAYGVDGDPDDAASAFRLDEERVVDGDVGFPIRQLSDIALKGLSPGINDPTTAENAMDSVTDTLVRFAWLDRPSALRADGDGVPRLLAISPTLDDLVRLGFDQVRRDAANRPSFAVRLLQLLADLRDAAPAAAECEEIDRQARLISDHAASLAEQQADQRLVTEEFQRLHHPGTG